MKENVYLDNAATTWPKPEAVYHFMDRFSRDVGVNAGRGSHALAADAEQLVLQTRRLLGAFAGCFGPADRVVFASNGTDALNTAINGLVAPDSHVVTTGLEHNAVARVLNHARRDKRVEVTAVPGMPDGYVDVSAVAAALRSDTAALIVNHASNVVGTVQALDELAVMARGAGVPMIVDAAQTIGVLPIDMDKHGFAVVAFPGHKGLFGPMGSGGLIVAEGVELEGLRFGGTGVDSASEFQPRALPWRLEPGTLGMPGIAGLHAAQLWFRALGEQLDAGDLEPPWQYTPPADVEAALERALDVSAIEHARLCRLAMAHIHSVECAHIATIEQVLRSYADVTVLGCARTSAQVATLSFVHAHIDAQEVADRLDADFGVCCRAGLQCAPWAHRSLGTLDTGGTVRLSPGFFTDEQDLAQLSAGLAEIF